MTSGSDFPFLLSLFSAAVEAAKPENCLPEYLKDFSPDVPTFVLGTGKAAADMAAAVYKHFGEACSGVVVTRYGYEAIEPTGGIDVLLANHPVPDDNSLLAGRRLLECAAEVPSGAQVLFLISGGGSALSCVPAPGISLEEKMQLHRFLLRSGASIDEMNTVRKQVSAIKGGQLAAKLTAPFTTLVISDVVGDDPSLIASGPTVPDTSSANQALAILDKYNWTPSQGIADCLARRMRQPHPSAVEGQYRIVANAKTAIDKAVELAETSGWSTEVIDYEQQGEAAEVARKHAQLAMRYAEQGKRVALFSGGELTVTLNHSRGKGGPNQEYMLAMAIELQASQGIRALACDTDGVDGSEDVAGAYVHQDTLKNAKELGLDPVQYLQTHDSYSFFHALNDHIKIGPTRTNVNDFRVILVG